MDTRITIQNIVEKIETGIQIAENTPGKTRKTIGQSDIQPIIEYVHKLRLVGKEITFPPSFRQSSPGQYPIEGVKLLLALIREVGFIESLESQELDPHREELRRCPDGVTLTRSDSMLTMDAHFAKYGTDDALSQEHPHRVSSELTQPSANVTIPLAPIPGGGGPDAAPLETMDADEGVVTIRPEDVDLSDPKQAARYSSNSVDRLPDAQIDAANREALVAAATDQTATEQALAAQK